MAYMTDEERQEFSNAAQSALNEPFLQEIMQEFADNMNFNLEGLPKYGLTKIAFHAALFARAHALGVAIEDLKGGSNLIETLLQDFQ